MTDEMLCHECLVSDRGHVPAVTGLGGTLLCERCAREQKEAEVARAQAIRTSVGQRPG